jgi:hypothetical protein
MSGGSSRGKERGDEGKSHCVGGVSGSDDFDEPVDQFSPESKSDFSKKCPLREYDNRKED